MDNPVKEDSVTLHDTITIRVERELTDGKRLFGERRFKASEAYYCNVPLEGLMAFYYKTLRASMQKYPKDFEANP